MSDIDELKKLSPEERIKRLKELESAKRKELDEAEKLMKESVGEMEKAEEIRQKMPVPQMKAVDIDSLFTQEEKEIYVHWIDVKETDVEACTEEIGSRFESTLMEVFE